MTYQKGVLSAQILGKINDIICLNVKILMTCFLHFVSVIVGAARNIFIYMLQTDLIPLDDSR